ncbi:MAG TPA: FAD-dependent oxidoreductase, partial [Rariglobus sp.]
DEFPDFGGWSYALYVRESRRMVSDYVMTEHNCRGTLVVEDPVGMAAYGMDSHNIRRIVINGSVVNEGDVQAGGFLPYPISYRSIVPKRDECANLLVPYCLSASHIGFGSIRMEPVFMVLGQSAAVAASLALSGKTSVQDVAYSALRHELESAGQILARPAQAEAFKIGETEAEPVVAK